MTRELTDAIKTRYVWVDITDPDDADLQKIRDDYHIHQESIEDVMQPDHLPKYERLKDYVCIILRINRTSTNTEADTVRELTQKIVLFHGKGFIITIHKKEWKELDIINKERVHAGECKDPEAVFMEIVKAALQTYDEPARKLTADLEFFEEHIFLKDKKRPVLKGLYFLKRKVDVIRRIMVLSFDLIDQLDSPDKSNATTRDIRDLYIKQQSVFDSLSENTNHLLGIYFNISAQKTNEIIRILTIFSVFFMPLTFIVGIYGMNFHFMPELNWRMGYPGVFILMGVVTLIVFIWFKKKKWL